MDENKELLKNLFGLLTDAHEAKDYVIVANKFIQAADVVYSNPENLKLRDELLKEIKTLSIA